MCLIPTRPCYKNVYGTVYMSIYITKEHSVHICDIHYQHYWINTTLFFCQFFPETLLKLVKGNRTQPLSTLVFCRNAKTVCFVGLFLKENGVNSSVLHADMPQRVLAVIFVTSPGHVQSDRPRKKKEYRGKKVIIPN